jgi:hypothetical protein
LPTSATVPGQRNIAPYAIGIVCLLQVFAVMGYLMREGRLAIVPIYDDVVYLIDGLERLAVLYRSGIGGFLADFYAHPAHSPFTAATSTLGFLLSSGEVWGPYLLNSVWVFIVACLGLVALRDSDVLSRIGILIAALAAPMFGYVVAEFRPDPVWGLLVGFALAVMAATDVVQSQRSGLFALGVLFGIAVLGKPTASPASAVVLGIGFTVQLVLSLVARRDWSMGLVARRVAIVALGAGLIVVPYIITNGAGILTYILTVMQSNSSVWKTNATALGHMTYYLNQATGTAMLGWIWYLAIPILVTCALVLTNSRDKPALYGFAGLLSALASAYIIVSLSEVKSLMIGSILYGTIIAAVTWSLGRIVSTLSIPGRVILIAGAVIFVAQWVPRAGMIHRSDPAMISTDEASKAAFPSVLQALRSGDRKTALVTVPGPVYAGTLDFLARQQGVTRKFLAGYTWNTWEMFLQGVASSDVIVLSEPGMQGQALGFNFPSVQFQERLLGEIRANHSFDGKAVFTDNQGRSVWLFVRK